MARRDTARSNGNKKRLSIAEQEGSILAVYADMIEHDDLDGMFDLMRHAGIALRPDPTTAILRHYWLGFDRGYDVNCAIEDLRAGRQLLRDAKNCDVNGGPNGPRRRQIDERCFHRRSPNILLSCAPSIGHARSDHERQKHSRNHTRAGSEADTRSCMWSTQD
jgi:hypothetical protein